MIEISPARQRRRAPRAGAWVVDYRAALQVHCPRLASPWPRFTPHTTIHQLRARAYRVANNRNYLELGGKRLLPPAQETAQSMPDGRSRLALLFAATLFVSAFLLFWIEPLIAKMLLPLLGGTPAVWNTCLLFFQVILLAGYAYVLAITKWLGLRQQAALHLLLLLLATSSLPIGISATAAASVPAQGDPVFWLLGSLLRILGLPFFVISATAPLLQKWFSATRHPSARDPYFLYAASNAGSLIALVGFPLLLEPNLRLPQQSGLWAGLYGVLALLIIVCARAVWQANASEAQAGAETLDEAEGRIERVTFQRRVRWTLLAFVPSSLVLGVTTYITTDIAAAPLLWVVPLAFYLLTFVFVFAQRQLLSRRLMIRLLPGAAIIITLIFVLEFRQPIWFSLPAHLFFFFVAAMVCHGQLADERPSSAHLAEYYLWIALGGVLGGIFNALVAPLVFNIVLEYPLAVVLACLMLPRLKDTGGTSAAGARPFDAVLPLGIMLLIAGVAILIARFDVQASSRVLMLLGAALLLTFASRRLLARRPAHFALTLGIVILGGIFYEEVTNRTLYRQRNFYGALRVSLDSIGISHRLYHGTTLHGTQFAGGVRRCEPLTYFHPTGPLGSVFEAFNARPAAPNVAIVGLGTGTTVAYAKPGQAWTFYEINPAVPRIARDARLFTYLQACAAAPVEIVMGDARLQLQHAPPGHYGLIVLDAFSSDAIPVHLLTREAVELYLSKLAEGGLLAIHISNRHLDLAPVIGDIARDANLVALLSHENRIAVRGKNSSRWVVVARRQSDIGTLLEHSIWQPLEGRARPQIWTDDFSNILSVLDWK